jgi:hypothetical protein
MRLANALICLLLFLASAASAEIKPEAEKPAMGRPGVSTEVLAKMTQNPVANLISVPFQWNLGFGAGPHNSYQSTLNIQPVIPITLNKDWNLITRTIFPVESWPAPHSGAHVPGIGDTTFSMFLSPASSGKFVWGFGPAFFCFQLRAAPNLKPANEGSGQQSLLFTVARKMTAGALVNNIWSFAGWGVEEVNSMTLQPFFNYNFPDGWYFTASLIITANWAANSLPRCVDRPARRRFRYYTTLGSQDKKTRFVAWERRESKHCRGWEE